MTSRTITLAGLAGHTGRGVRVAVVDSGVHGDHPHVGGLSGGVSVDAGGVASDDVMDRLGHGTAVAAAIREKAPACKLVSVKVFDRTLSTTGVALETAIRWAADERVALINLSLGTTNPAHRDALSAAVAYATARGATVVSAAPQAGADWAPGGLANVVGVEIDASMPRDELRAQRLPDGGVRLFASPLPRPIPGVPVARNFRGPSFAVANATGFLALLSEAGELHLISMA